MYQWNGIGIGETSELDACVSWSFEDEYDGEDYNDDEQESNIISNYECCLFTLPTTVKNCGDFRVYHIGPTQACSIAYCSAPNSNNINSTYPWLHKTSIENQPGSKDEVCSDFQLQNNISLHLKFYVC